MSTNKGLVLKYDSGFTRGAQGGGGSIITTAKKGYSTARKGQKAAKKHKVASRGKQAADTLGVTKELDRLTGGLFSRGAQEVISRGYGHPAMHRRRRRY